MEPIIDMNFVESSFAVTAEGLFYILTLIFILFSLSVAYHWLAYGTNRSHSILMLVAYLMISTIFFIGMSVSLTQIV